MKALSLCSCALALALLPRPASAQKDDWASIPVASNPTVKLEQSLAVVQQGNTVNAFSCLTKAWTQMTASGAYGPPVWTLQNEVLTVQDGPIFYGYSPYTGAFVPKYIGPNAVLQTAGSPQTWHAVVVDGNRVHAFFALSGKWETYVLPAPPTIVMGRFCFMIDDGSTVYAVSSFYGTEVPLIGAPAGTGIYGCYGNVGLASSASTLYGFSAARNTWSSMSYSGLLTVTTGNSQPAFVAIQDGAKTAMFSGHTGAFTTVSTSPSATVYTQRYEAIVVDSPFVYGYSALSGKVDRIVATPVNVTMEQMFALVDTGPTQIAFSASQGEFAAPFGATATDITTQAQIALAMPPGATVPYGVYSSYLNRWDTIPANLTSPTTYYTAASVVIVEASGGMYGWSQRGAGWIHEPSGVIDDVLVGSNPPKTAETIGLRSGTTLYTFNPRTEVWRSTTTASPANLVRAHSMAILAEDGNDVYAFSVWNDRWSKQALAGTFTSGSAQVQSAWATDGKRVYAYGGLGQLAMTGEFPDLYRAASRGALLNVDIVGEPQSLAVLLLSPRPASIPLSFGTLLIDPTALAVWTQQAIPPSGVIDLTTQLPDAPGLSGVEVYLQAAIVGPRGLYLTNSVFPTIY